MTVTLELKPEVEQRVAAEAAARGQTVEAYLTSIIESGTLTRMPEEGSLAEFEADMDRLAEGSERLPILDPDALTREHMYADHD